MYLKKLDRKSCKKFIYIFICENTLNSKTTWIVKSDSFHFYRQLILITKLLAWEETISDLNLIADVKHFNIFTTLGLPLNFVLHSSHAIFEWVQYFVGGTSKITQHIVPLVVQEDIFHLHEDKSLSSAWAVPLLMTDKSGRFKVTGNFGKFPQLPAKSVLDPVRLGLIRLSCLGFPKISG